MLNPALKRDIAQSRRTLFTFGQVMKEQHVLTSNPNSARRGYEMNAGMKLAAVYVAAAILVAGCGQSDSNSAGTSPSQPAAAAKPAESKPVAPKDTSIKIKGLYIGMDIQTVPALLKESLAIKGWAISEVSRSSSGDLFITIINPNDMTFAARLESLPDGKVMVIALGSPLVNDLFNAADMDASDFVKQFISAYNIPEMRVSDDLQSWAYTSPNGEKVIIFRSKGITIVKVESAQDRKQSFN
jgi:hypothetical protein